MQLDDQLVQSDPLGPRYAITSEPGQGFDGVQILNKDFEFATVNVCLNSKTVGVKDQSLSGILRQYKTVGRWSRLAQLAEESASMPAKSENADLRIKVVLY